MSNMSKDEIKQAIEGFTQFMREMWNNPNLTVPKDLAEKYDISSEFRGKESEDKDWWNAEYKEPTTKNDLPQTMEELFKYLTDIIPSWKVILIDKWTDFKVWLWIKTHKGADRWE